MRISRCDDRRGVFRVLATLVAVLTPVGFRAQSTPPDASYISILPGQNIQGFVNLAPEGAAFLLGGGIHRMQTVSPKNNQVFVGETGAILSGARVVTLSPSGGAWVASGQTQEGVRRGTVADGICRSSQPRCGYPEDLFLDDTRLLHVDTLAAGGPGKWYFDYAADRIYMWDDPTGKRVEASVTAAAFTNSGTGVTIRSLIVEKYATPTQTGAVTLGRASVIEDSEVRWNHAWGIRSMSQSVVRRSHAHHHGGLGFAGSGEDILVEDSETSYNGGLYHPFWESGGSKWAFTRNLIVRRNVSHHNFGPGLWTDIDNYFALYEDNLVEDNDRGGIFHEISFDAVIRNNTLRRNGTARDAPGWATGAGIEVTTSSNVEIYGNTLVDNWQGITGIEDHRVPRVGSGGWTLANLYVHHNTITTTANLAGGGRSGVAETSGRQAAFSEAANNRYDFNTYYLGAAQRYFFWLGADRDEHQWRSYGQDVNGAFRRAQ